ncbi:MAG: VgrG-related protein [Acidimicrobiales bacterium]|nr:VgrG-related protein [Acidimicrobiales bacterium]
MPRDPGSPLNPTITVNGSPLSSALVDNLIDLRVERRIQLPGSFSMRFRDKDFSLIDGAGINLGDTVDISLPDESGADVSVICGEVTAIGVDPGAGQTHELVVSGLDLAHRLAHNKEHRTYLNVTAPAIVSQIAGRAGLSAVASGPTHTFEYLLQVDSDQRFLDDLARRCGCDWWVENKELHFAPPASSAAVTLTWGDDLRRFKLRLSTADQIGKVTVAGWNPDTQKTVEGNDAGTANAPEDTVVGATSPAGDALVKARKALNGFAPGVRTTHVDVQTVDEANNVAKALAAESVAASLHGRGEAIGRPELKAGGWVEVANMGDTMSGTYAITEIEHVWGAGLGLVTRFAIGGRRPDELVDLLGAGTGGGAVAPGPLGDRATSFNHTVIGVVTNINDPDKTGRVKVKLPILGDQQESTWCRVLAPGAGKQAGLALQPEVGDEVLVVFERGDLRRPVVLGGLWSKTIAQPGPPAADGKLTKGVLRSRKGHELELGDGDGDDASHIKIKLANGTVLRVGQDKVTLEVKKGPFSLVAGNGSIDISDAGDITIKGANVTIKADNKLSLNGQAAAELVSSSAAKVQGATTEVKGSGTLSLSSGGMTEVKGSLVKLG